MFTIIPLCDNTSVVEKTPTEIKWEARVRGPENPEWNFESWFSPGFKFFVHT
eukprot:m.164835 g.164835  ORF g.164835 m.164835 type:complete len:52 (+) comp24957_c1_seq10:554-709(+)